MFQYTEAWPFVITGLKILNIYPQNLGQFGTMTDQKDVNSLFMSQRYGIQTK